MQEPKRAKTSAADAKKLAAEQKADCRRLEKLRYELSLLKLADKECSHVRDEKSAKLAAKLMSAITDQIAGIESKYVVCYAKTDLGPYRFKPGQKVYGVTEHKLIVKVGEPETSVMTSREALTKRMTKCTPDLLSYMKFMFDQTGLEMWRPFGNWKRWMMFVRRRYSCRSIDVGDILKNRTTVDGRYVIKSFKEAATNSGWDTVEHYQKVSTQLARELIGDIIDRIKSYVTDEDAKKKMLEGATYVQKWIANAKMK
jgi:hypothetical protein